MCFALPVPPSFPFLTLIISCFLCLRSVPRLLPSCFFCCFLAETVLPADADRFSARRPGHGSQPDHPCHHQHGHGSGKPSFCLLPACRCVPEASAYQTRLEIRASGMTLDKKRSVGGMFNLRLGHPPSSPFCLCSLSRPIPSHLRSPISPHDALVYYLFHFKASAKLGRQPSSSFSSFLSFSFLHRTVPYRAASKSIPSSSISPFRPVPRVLAAERRARQV